MGTSLFYFAYGSNLHPVRLCERVPSARMLRTIALGGYALRFHKRGRDGSAKCNAHRSANAEDMLHGALYEIDAGEKPVLDRHEGVGAGYRIETFALSVCGGEREAFTYIAMDEYIDDSLRPFDWYRALVWVGAAYHRLPRAYIQAIAQIEPVADSDPHRVARHRRLLARIRG